MPGGSNYFGIAFVVKKINIPEKAVKVYTVFRGFFCFDLL
jgi:hypothetical protein